MKIFSVMVLLNLCVLGLAGCSGGNTAVNNANSNRADSGISSSVYNGNIDAGISGSGTELKDFVTQTATGGIAEVELGRLAQNKAQNAEVKNFARKMVQDHSNANTELKALAGKKNVTLPIEMDAEHKALRDKLAKLSGAEFDREYMKGQVVSHERTVGLFQRQADKGSDPDVKSWATKTLPNLRMHLEMAREITGKLK